MEQTLYGAPSAAAAHTGDISGRLKGWAKAQVSPHSKFAFISKCCPGARLFDVGCGNGSPSFTKALRPDIYYVGLDVMDLGHAADPRSVADEYIITTPELFAARVADRIDEFDDVISAHNLEHCNEPDAVLRAMTRALRRGGRLMLAFPSEASVRFPSRAGCLNFYDDPTHSSVPNFTKVLAALRDEGMNITFASRRYRPLLKLVGGAMLEPASRIRRQVLWGTWALWGFESVIWAQRL
jgi:SAM-dependent methyltransferase